MDDDEADPELRRHFSASTGERPKFAREPVGGGWRRRPVALRPLAWRLSGVREVDRAEVDVGAEHGQLEQPPVAPESRVGGVVPVGRDRPEHVHVDIEREQHEQRPRAPRRSPPRGREEPCVDSTQSRRRTRPGRPWPGSRSEAGARGRARSGAAGVRARAGRRAAGWSLGRAVPELPRQARGKRQGLAAAARPRAP